PYTCSSTPRPCTRCILSATRTAPSPRRRTCWALTTWGCAAVPRRSTSARSPRPSAAPRRPAGSPRTWRTTSCTAATSASPSTWSSSAGAPDGPGHPAPAAVAAARCRRPPPGPRSGRGVASTRRSSTRRRRSSSRRRRSAAASRELPFVGPGERLWVLDVPYGTQVEGASWHPAVSMHLHVGRTLPAHLAPYAPGPHTLGRFLENHLNPGEPAPNPEPAEDLE